MRIDPTSAWRAELVSADGTLTAFDTPRCALLSWRSGKTPAKSLRVVEYYERTARDGNDVRFLIGGDVVGPMGPDLVPVDPSRAPTRWGRLLPVNLSTCPYSRTTKTPTGRRANSR